MCVTLYFDKESTPDEHKGTCTPAAPFLYIKSTKCHCITRTQLFQHSRVTDPTWPFASSYMLGTICRKTTLQTRRTRLLLTQSWHPFVAGGWYRLWLTQGTAGSWKRNAVDTWDIMLTLGIVLGKGARLSFLTHGARLSLCQHFYTIAGDTWDVSVNFEEWDTIAIDACDTIVLAIRVRGLAVSTHGALLSVLICISRLLLTRRTRVSF